MLHALIISFFIYSVWVYIDMKATYHKTTFAFDLLDASLFMGFQLGLIYISYWLFIPKFLIKKQYFKFFIGFIIIIGGFCLGYNLVAYICLNYFKIYFDLFRINWQFTLPLYAFLVALAGTSFRLFVQWFKDVKEKKELEKQNFKSQLSILKNQLNPHFLFNTLNNIDSLITENRPEASLALNKLSGLMRYMVYDSEKEMVPLQDEINYIQNYISLQKLRIPNEDIIRLTVTGNAEDKHIAAMLFIPFVENAFKHSSLKDKPENKIDIKIVINENEISFSCFNNIAEINKDKSSGVGLDLVRKRLDLIYKKNYKLEINKTDKEFTVNLNIKL